MRVCGRSDDGAGSMGFTAGLSAVNNVGGVRSVYILFGVLVSRVQSTGAETIVRCLERWEQIEK